MTNLIVCRGMNKRAAAEDGPSFEQQFGILANALVADKYPKLDRHKLAFQLIDKTEDNSRAVGVTVYLLGKAVVFVPAFFKNSKIRTGDMMFLAQTQQFLPLSDPWLAWVQDKDLQESGDVVDHTMADKGMDTSAVTVREITDPIIKTACVYLKGLLRSSKDLLASDGSHSVLNATLGMGKQASAELLDRFVSDTSFLNSALCFYSGDEIDGFAKRASEMWEEPADSVELIMPFTKEAKELTEEEQKLLTRDGYFIRKTAAEDSATVVRKRNIRKSFSTISRPGLFQLLSMDGTIKEGLVLRNGWLETESDYRPARGHFPEQETYGDPGPADTGLGHEWFTVFTSKDSQGMRLPQGAMIMAVTGERSFDKDMLDGYGKAVTPGNVDKIDWGDKLLCPDGAVYNADMCVYAHNQGWISRDGTRFVTIAEDDRQLSPICSAGSVILPYGTRVIKAPEEPVNGDSDNGGNKGRHMIVPVVLSNLDHFLSAYSSKNFDSVKMTTDGGGDIEVATDDAVVHLSIKEASLKLVRDHNVEPGVARAMLNELHAGAGRGNPRTETYLISKKAADDGWEDAAVASHEHQNIGDQQEHTTMPPGIEDPEQLQQTAVAAAENGIKEVFDVTALKMLVRQSRVLDEIHDDIPLMMQMLDSLCRKLFMLYWHTDEFEDKYGTVKLKSLEDNIKNTLDSLSELTIFFKLRNVDGDTGYGQVDNGLMEGHGL